jgi:hypothetical protein
VHTLFRPFSPQSPTPSLSPPPLPLFKTEPVLPFPLILLERRHKQ